MGIRSLVKSSIFPPKHTHTPIEIFHAPIWKIPNELVLLIFRKLCYDEDDNTILAKGQPTPRPLRLSAVCSNWRRIMLNDPTLWSTISVAFTKAGKKPNGRAIHIFLERSKNNSIDNLSTIATFAWGPFQKDHPPPSLSGSCQCSPPMENALPHRGFRENLQTRETVSNFQVVPMPNLHLVSIATFQTPIDLHESDLPWTQLTSLRLQGLHNVPSLVQLRPNLLELVLAFDSELGDALPRSPVVVRHQRVQLLSLRFKKDPSSQYVEEPNMIKL
ncbi:hypothetical protein BDP27DRAFT_1431174 [Rhodocollybia butyracea]|uniref:F-box domain-containing protein n=1 Tax=Rhodocollybia butyracea TaxID=206335 RepID=A0A9P5TZL0_9AGAR|nr:hypothetical protein BDP27DRAFT_1431174 [Rhodocollybia butyracea]